MTNIHVSQPLFITESEEEADYSDLPSHRRLPVLTALLATAVLLGAAFGAGVLIQKHHDSSLTSSSPGGLPAGLSGGFPGLGGGTSTGGPATAPGSETSSASPVVVGTVVTVNGQELKVKDLGGANHDVHLSKTTTVTFTSTGSAFELAPGQTLSVVGTKAGDGSVTATAVTVR